MLAYYNFKYNKHWVHHQCFLQKLSKIIIITKVRYRTRRYLLGQYTGKRPLHLKHVSHFTGKCKNSIKAYNPLHKKM